MILVENERIIAISDNLENGNHPDLDFKAQQQILGSVIKQLPAEDARIITLFYLAEQSSEEVSIIMGLTISNVKVRLFRARQKLKEILESKKASNSKYH